MDQKYTVFVRGFWDSEIIPIRERFEKGHYNLIPPKGLAGYTQLDEALKTAAWSVCLNYTPNNEFGRPNVGLYKWDVEKASQKVKFNHSLEASRVVKSAAKFFGADLVGIAPYDERWVYSSWYDFSSKESVPAEFPFKVKNVIVLALQMDQEACLTSPSLIACAATGLGYSRMGEIGVKLAAFLRMLGYHAIPSGNDTGLSIPLAIQAGLGEMGRSGMLITPQYGPRVRLFKIYTDMALEADKPITFGVSKFCIKCRKCAQSCPAGAITFEPRPTTKGPSISNSPGILKWYTNPESCFKFWAINGDDCINCIACCPYNKWASWHHGLTQKVTQSLWKEE